MTKNKLPKEFQALLPSSRIDDLDSERDKRYILENLLHNATYEAWRWMLRTYSKSDIVNVVKTSRTLNTRDVIFWSYLLHIPRSQIQCLQKGFLKTQKKYWPY